MTREAVVVDSVRTALTKAHRGSFNLTPPADQLAHTFRALLERNPGVDPEEIADVITGCGMPEGCQGMNLSRIAAMAAGLPVTVAATTVNRFCASGSQAVMMAAHAILHEGAEIAVGAGVETITMMQDGTQNVTRLINPAAQKRFPGLYFPMGITAEVVAERYKVSREDQDRYALQSQQRYAAAAEGGLDRRRDRAHEGPAKGHEEGRGAVRGGLRSGSRRVQPARHHARRPLQAAPGLQEGRRYGDGGQRLAALRRGLRHAADVVGAGQGAGYRAARDLSRDCRCGLSAGRDGNRPDLRRSQAPQEARPHASTTSISSSSTRPSPPRSCSASACWRFRARS